MKKRLFAFSLIFMLLFIWGCGSADEDAISAQKESTLLKIGNEDIGLSKALLFIIGQKDLLDDKYGNEIWNIDLGEGGIGTFVKDKLKSRIALCFAGALLAEEEGIELSADDEKLTLSASNYFYSKLSEESKDSLGLTSEEVYQVYKAYRLSEIGYSKIISDNQTEISEDEARVIKLYQIRVSTSGLAGEALNAKKTLINEAKKQLNDGADFYELASKYDEGGQIELVATRDDLSDKAEKVAFELNRDEVSEPFSDGDAFVIYKCIEPKDDERTKARREKLLAAHTSDKYIEMLKSYLADNPIVWSDELWDEIDVSSLKLKFEVSFYDVYDMFFPKIEVEDGIN